MSGLIRRGLANSATNQIALRLRTGLREAWRAAGGQVDADSSSWRTFVEEKGLINGASGQGRRETIPRLREWLVSNPTDLSQTRWGFAGDVLQNEEKRQLTLKLWLAATARSPLASDLKRK